jgi:hypothetical protein
MEPITFAPGQVWRYRARPQEVGATLTVLRVDEDPELGTIVHVRLDNLRLRNPHEPDGYSHHVAHLPFGCDALARSVTDSLGTCAELPNFDEAYAIWRRAYDAGEGAVFRQPVAEVLATIETTLHSGALG